MGQGDDIAHVDYSKYSSMENALAIVGIELKNPTDLEPLIEIMKDNNFYRTILMTKLIYSSIGYKSVTIDTAFIININS